MRRGGASGELAAFVRGMNKPLPTVAIENPNGTWSLRGRVPAACTVVHTDGRPLSPDELERFADTARQCGPGFAYRPLDAKARVFKTREEALACARDNGAPDAS